MKTETEVKHTHKTTTSAILGCVACFPMKHTPTLKDFSKLIGLVCRGGRYSPSNERSEEKYNAIFSLAGFVTAPTVMDDQMLAMFLDISKKHGYTVKIISRGLGR